MNGKMLDSTYLNVPSTYYIVFTAHKVVTFFLHENITKFLLLP